jgi:hypothetical protein
MCQTSIDLTKSGVQGKDKAYHNVNKVQNQGIYEWILDPIDFVVYALFLPCTPEKQNFKLIKVWPILNLKSDEKLTCKFKFRPKFLK